MNGVELDDRGFTLGHGLFETVLWEAGGPHHWTAHLERLTRGCAALGLPPPSSRACRLAAEAAVAAAGAPARAALRLNWSAGVGGRGLDLPTDPRPVLTAAASPLAPAALVPAKLVTAVRVRRNDRSPASRLKTLSYIDNVLARAEAREVGADEALMLNTAGEAACGAAANIFWIRHGVVCTPALECGVLDGVMRGEVLRACVRLGLPVSEVRVGPAQLRDAPLFLTNSLIGVRPVGSLDGAPSPESPVVRALAEAVGRPAG